MFQAIWLILLSPAFVSAYVHGILLAFPDGVTRRVFPRILTYSADYPEQYVAYALPATSGTANRYFRMLVAGIKYLSMFPCVHCLVKKPLIHLMGTKHDMGNRVRLKRSDTARQCGKIELVRSWIFEKGRVLTSVVIDCVLGPMSLTAVRVSYYPLIQTVCTIDIL